MRKKPTKYYPGAIFPITFESVVRKVGNLYYVSVPRVFYGLKVEVRLLEFKPEWQIHKGFIVI